MRLSALLGRSVTNFLCRPVALTVEHRTPNPRAGGSNPSWPAIFFLSAMGAMKTNAESVVEKKGLIGKFHDFRTFFEQSKMEMKKVVWPDKQETISTSSAVLLLVVVMAFFLGLLDLGLTKIVAAILS